MASSKSGTTGATLTDVLTLAWSRGFATKGDYAREHANLVAVAASRGQITTRIDKGNYGTRWLITPKGLEAIWGFRG